MNQENELLEKVKEQYAEETSSENWREVKHYLKKCHFEISEAVFDEIAIRYANELLKLRLEKARHNDGTEKRNLPPEYWAGWQDALDCIEINKRIEEI